MNEVGVDPGIDHMLAMQCFDEIRIRNGRVNSYSAIIYYNNGIQGTERIKKIMKQLRIIDQIIIMYIFEFL